MDPKGFIRGFGSHGTGPSGAFNATALPGLEPIIAILGARNPLVQLLSVVHQVIGEHLGLDPTLVLSLLGFLWAFNRLGRQIYALVANFVSQYAMSDIHINSADEIYLHLMKWLAAQPHLIKSRSLTAETLSKTAWEEEGEDEAGITGTNAAGGSDDNDDDEDDANYLNFSHQEAAIPPRFVPAVGSHSFWFQGTYFRLTRSQERFFEDSSSAPGGAQTFRDRERLVISCLGRSPAPIKQLLQRAKDAYYHDHYAKTTVKRPSPQGTRRFGGRSAWTQVAQRPVRPMKTVVLDARQKRQLLADINEYLHPATPRWYANRGIPLRRGYLFHGPPGTGKTSLSFALAGVFGLDIFVISLLEPTLSEEDLLALFNSLPRRCVVLLEDIDTAGLTRPKEEPTTTAAVHEEEEEEKGEKKEKDEPGKERKPLLIDSKTKDTTTPTTNGDLPPAAAAAPRRGGNHKRNNNNNNNNLDGYGLTDLARELKRPWMNDDKKGISLSGLLNAIDGVASHEGRVLIMTTNKPETLDDALIRPGRVDLQVAFTNATREQARELFVRMYEADSSSGEKSRKIDDDDDDRLHRHRLTLEQLRAVADEFAQKVPDLQFSPAELQGFLLKRKKDPRKAVDEVGPWVVAMLKQKASKTKVLDVQ